MRIAAIIVGIDNWEKYTLPLIRSLGKYEPDCLVTVVDNNSKEPYPYHPVVEGNQHYLLSSLTERICYSQAINHGKEMSNEADWYIALSNDVLCTGPFMHMLERQDGEAVIGPLVKNVLGFDYVEGWCVCIPRMIWERVGGWDERFIGSDFEDVAFSTAARQQGFWLEQVNLPFVHLDQRQRYRITDFAAVNAHNQALFLREYAGKVTA